jgi:hypothetical protein
MIKIGSTEAEVIDLAHTNRTGTIVHGLQARVALGNPGRWVRSARQVGAGTVHDAKLGRVKAFRDVASWEIKSTVADAEWPRRWLLVRYIGPVGSAEDSSDDMSDDDGAPDDELDRED